MALRFWGWGVSGFGVFWGLRNNMTHYMAVGLGFRGFLYTDLQETVFVAYLPQGCPVEVPCLFLTVWLGAFSTYC